MMDILDIIRVAIMSLLLIADMDIQEEVVPAATMDQAIIKIKKSSFC